EARFDIATGEIECSFIGPAECVRGTRYLSRRWRFSERPADAKSDFSIREAIPAAALLSAACVRRRFASFPGLMRWTFKYKYRPTRRTRGDLARLISALDAVRPLLPCDVNCLDIAAAAARIASRWGLQPQLVVGMRTAPLTIHAWTEVHGMPFTDAADVRDYYAVLATFPDDSRL
ncbi:MAG: lasso peptide biosynthesis B2 protein, partial [Deltaproteobacteria bacterium]|nr:lasso peptide biosynthesis B2 protein [Deltaproteobacteria bacterium]